ncbi:hypothetical protein IWX49DRAFT_614741 [Phyllosticta citricarpa]
MLDENTSLSYDPYRGLVETFRFSRETGFVTNTAPRDLGHDEVLMKPHSGICYTDVHAKEKRCGLGHEGVGTVLKLGEGIKDLDIGERVGWGSGSCKVCAHGYRQYSAEACGFAFGELDHGSWETTRSKTAPFAATAGVVGIGGLGHVAVLFAKAMGCAVTALSDTPDKNEDAQEMGADEFIFLDREQQSNPGNKVGDSSPIDVLLLCANEIPSLTDLIPLLARRARIVCMTIQQTPIEVPYMLFILPGLRIIASTEASRQHFQNTSVFVARHAIKLWTLRFPLTRDGMADASKTLEEGR